MAWRCNAGRVVKSMEIKRVQRTLSERCWENIKKKDESQACCVRTRYTPANRGGGGQGKDGVRLKKI